MIESGKMSHETVLDQDTLELIGSATANAAVSAERMAPLRDRVMQRVDEDLALSSLFLTIRADEGTWIEISPLAEKKTLSVDTNTGAESFLLRLHPGALLEQHHHAKDEMCIVLEGDVSFDDIHLKVGDYHLARKGSSHGAASTVHGALLFLQSGYAAA